MDFLASNFQGWSALYLGKFSPNFMQIGPSYSNINFWRHKLQSEVNAGTPCIKVKTSTGKSYEFVSFFNVQVLGKLEIGKQGKQEMQICSIAR